jgi:DNA mismatch repair protein MutH
LRNDNNQAPNGQYFELKQISLKTLKNGKIVPKETMQITMINPNEKLAEDFFQSHVYKKMKSLLICPILYSSPGGVTKLYRVDTFDLGNHKTLKQLKKDYELIRDSLNTKGFHSLKSEMGVYIQPRTKGSGHGSKSRAFYARTKFLQEILNLG